jgi:hypothetical protein
MAMIHADHREPDPPLGWLRHVTLSCIAAVARIIDLAGRGAENPTARAAGFFRRR